MKKIVMSIVLVNLLAACSGTKKPETTVATPESTKPTATQTGINGSQASVDPLDDATSILAKRSVYYPLDVDTVQAADKPAVEAHAKYLAEHANRNIRLEGNCDERGSNEYNLALGQRRADGVKKMLELGGAKAGQIESVSYGEEKPKGTAHDEASWSQNRRTDLNYAK